MNFRKLLKLVLVAAIVFAAAPLFAQSCGSQTYHRQQTYSNNYSNNYANVATPEYHQDYPQQVVNNIFYEVGADVRNYAVAPQAVLQAQVGQIQRSIQREQDSMKELLSQYQQQTQPPPPQVVYVYPPPQQQPGAMPAQPAAPVQPQPTPAQPQQPAPPTFNMTKQASVLEAKCAKCHSGVNAKGGLDLTKTITCLQFVEAYKRITSDDPTVRMPFKLPGLTGDEVKVALDELTALVGRPQDARANIGQTAQDIAALIK